MAIFIRDLVTNLYEKLGPKFRHAKVVGQLCVTPILYCYENAQIWRPCETDGTRTQASQFEIVASCEDAYDRPLPLKTPALSIHEEFPVVRAKRRPVILIRGAEGAHAGPSATKPLPMVVPLYSVEDSTGRQKFPADFLARVQRLEFPEFFCLPADGAAVEKDSLAPLFRMTHAFDGHLEPSQWKLSDPLTRIFRGQIDFWLTEEYAGDYEIAREMLLNPDGK